MTRRRFTDAVPQSNDRALGLRPTEEALATLESAIVALAEAGSLEQIKDIRDKAEAVRQYAHNARTSLTLQNKAAELKLRAERRAGKLLRELGLHGGNRRSSTHDSRSTLAELGISQHQSARWQREASVPESAFCALVAAALREGTELTSAALLRLAASRREPSVAGRHLDPRHLHILDPEVSPRPEGDSSPPRLIVAEIRDHCATINGMLSPLQEGTNPAQLDPCVGRVLRQLTKEIRGLLDGLEQWAAAAFRI